MFRLHHPHPFGNRGAVSALHRHARCSRHSLSRRFAAPANKRGCPPSANRVLNIEEPERTAYLSKKHLGSDVYQTIGSEGSTQAAELPKSSQITRYLTIPGTIFVDKTRYIETLDQVGEYNYMFLRPRRFGKTTFLNMLCTYYDIAGADTWQDIFKGLYIGEHPTASRSKHMVLRLDLSGIDPYNRAGITSSFNRVMLRTLSEFLETYRAYLGPVASKIILNPSDGSASLEAVLGCVRRSGHTLFVGIDEYDAPANNLVFDGSGPQMEPEKSKEIADLEMFFKASLFAPLKQAYEGSGNMACISKYFVTGVLPAFRDGMSPLIAADLISADPSFHGLCGLTEEQVGKIAKEYLAMDDQVVEGTCWALKKCYNGYYFAELAGDESEKLYNPTLVHHYLRQFKAHKAVSRPEASPTFLNTKILASIADRGNFSVNDIIRLIASGTIESVMEPEFGFAELARQIGKNQTITLSLMVYLGILTHGIVPGTLRIPNDIMKENVLSRIRQYLEHQEHLYPKFGPAKRELQAGNIQPFVELLEEFMHYVPVRSLRTTNEATLHGITQMILDPPRARVSELRLVMDGTKKYGDDRYGFVDVFISNETGDGVILELKDARVSGLLSGEQGEWKTKPGYSDSERISKKVLSMDENSLNAMPYMYYSEEDKKIQRTTVGRMRQDARTQLGKYMDVMKMGTAKGFSCAGVWDARLTASEAPYPTKLYGFVVMGVAGSRVLWEPVGPVETRVSYKGVGTERVT